MADEAHASITIAAPPERCFAVALDFESYPAWATDVKSVEVLERDDEGRGTRVRYEISALGRTIGYVLAYDFADAPSGFAWVLDHGDLLTRLDGSYRFDPDGSGTAVGYLLTVDLSLPLPGFMKKKAAGVIVDNAMQQLKRFIEAGAAD